MAEKTVLQMQFMTDQNKKVHIDVPTPVQPVDNAKVDAAMALIVSKNIFALPQGSIVKVVGASVIDTSTTTVG